MTATRSGLLGLCLALELAACGGSDSGNDAVDAGAQADAPPFVPDGGTTTAVFRQPCLIERRQVSDDKVLHRSERSYDDKGRLTVQVMKEGWDYWEEAWDVVQRDQAGNPIMNEVLLRTFRYSYDHNDRRTLEERDDDEDGTADSIVFYYNDPATGRNEYRVVDYNIDDGWSGDQRYDLTYDGDGKLISQVGTNLDTGVITQTWAYSYDANGRLVTVDRNNLPDTNACLDARETRVYDADGRLIRLELDGDRQYNDCAIQVDGTVDLVIHYDYDDEGRVIQARYDTLGDSSIERIETRLYECN